MLAGLTPDLLGAGGSILFIPIPTDRLVSPRMPKARDPFTLLFGVQRTAAPGNPALLVDMRVANAALHLRARAAGGASYSHFTPFHRSLQPMEEPA